MSLESHLQSDRLNVKRLTTERSEAADHTFDPERDIPESLRRDMEEAFRICEETSLHGDRQDQRVALLELAILAAAFKTIFPNRTGFDIGTELRQRLWKDVEIRARRGEYDRSVLQAIRILYGKQTDELPTSSVRDTWQSMIEITTLEAERDAEEISRLANELATFRFAFPLAPASLSDEMWESMKKELDMGRGEGDFTRMASNMRIIHPERFGELDVTPRDWSNMQQRLLTVAPAYAAELAMHMQILAAKEVEVTAEGLRLVMPPRRDTLTSPEINLPQSRKF